MPGEASAFCRTSRSSSAREVAEERREEKLRSGTKSPERSVAVGMKPAV